MCFAANNRVETHNERDTSTTEAAALPPSAFLPGPDDFQALRDHMAILVMRVIAEHFVIVFAELDEHVNKHIAHEHTKEMRQESEIVSCF
jgi:hypothetical protein